MREGYFETFQTHFTRDSALTQLWLNRCELLPF